MKKLFPLLVSGLLMAAPAFSTLGWAAPPVLLSPHEAPPYLPSLPLLTTEGTPTNTQAIQGSAVLILFHPDCDHCQREAEAIREHAEAFSTYSLYFITYAPLEEIKQFAQDYQLSDQPNVFFAAAEVQPIVDTFGSVPTPSLYIYSDQRKLVKAFEGETPIEDVLEHL